VSPSRRALVVLLALATVLFAVGVIAERSVDDKRTDEPASAIEQHGAGEAGETAESGEAGERGEAGEHQASPTEASDTENEEDERLLGVDLESTPLVILSVAAALTLTGLAASRVGQLRLFLLGVLVIALVWAALDIREVVHQIDESRAGIAVITAVVAALHLAAAGVAGMLGRAPEPRS
jgi:hypothetical protein